MAQTDGRLARKALQAITDDHGVGRACPSRRGTTMSQFSLDDDLFDEPTRKADKPAEAPKAHPFEAELDLCELDDRGRPTPHWAAKACKLSQPG